MHLEFFNAYNARLTKESIHIEHFQIIPPGVKLPKGVFGNIDLKSPFWIYGFATEKFGLNPSSSFSKRVVSRE